MLYPVRGVPFAKGAVHVTMALLATTEVTGATGVTGIVAQRIEAARLG